MRCLALLVVARSRTLSAESCAGLALYVPLAGVGEMHIDEAPVSIAEDSVTPKCKGAAVSGLAVA